MAISRLSRDYEAIRQNPWFADHKGLSATSVLFYSRKNRYLLSSILGLMGFFIGWRIGGYVSEGLLGGFICYIIPQITIKHSAWKHRNKLEKQIAITLNAIGNAIMEGQTVFEAIQAAAGNAPDAIRKELFVVARQVKSGISLEEALEDWESRIQRPRTSNAIRMLCGAIRAHVNLGEAFKQAGHMVVENTRLEIEQKVQVIQLRVRALLLSLVPLVFLVGIYLVDSSYLTPLLTTPIGWLCVGLMAMMQFVTYKLILAQKTF